MGTGHAVYLVKNALPKDYSGDVIVTCADNPGVDSSLLDRLIDCHHRYKQQLGKVSRRRVERERESLFKTNIEICCSDSYGENIQYCSFLWKNYTG